MISTRFALSKHHLNGEDTTGDSEAVGVYLLLSLSWYSHFAISISNSIVSMIDSKHWINLCIPSSPFFSSA